MPKKTTLFFCKECGYETTKWLGQCPGCKAWSSFQEAPAAQKSTGIQGVKSIGYQKPVKLSEVSMDESDRISTGISELDRVLGGGIVKGSLVLIGGDPGIGKSTILLEVCANLAENGKKVLYISGEESLQQIKMRAIRMKVDKNDILMVSETDINTIESVIEEEKPDMVVIDSIQTMYREEVDSAPGSTS